MSGTREFVFKKNKRGELKFVGDFEGLYSATIDPWGQSAMTGDQLAQYYVYSRTQLYSAIKRRMCAGAREKFTTGLEVGCGHGFVVDLLTTFTGLKWDGLDISDTACTHATQLFPKYTFYVGDITKPVINTEPHYNVIVLGQILWYILHSMPVVIENCSQLLLPDGLLVVSQAFLTGEQQYGCDVANGFHGTLKMLMGFDDKFRMVEMRYEDRLGLAHHDGLFILRKV